METGEYFLSQNEKDGLAKKRDALKRKKLRDENVELQEKK
jgi:adenylate kinase